MQFSGMTKTGKIYEEYYNMFFARFTIPEKRFFLRLVPSRNDNKTLFDTLVEEYYRHTEIEPSVYRAILEVKVPESRPFLFQNLDTLKILDPEQCYDFLYTLPKYYKLSPNEVQTLCCVLDNLERNARDLANDALKSHKIYCNGVEDATPGQDIR